MKGLILKFIIWFLITCAFSGLLSGCASSKPNTPFQGSYPSGFNELFQANPLLAKEIGKIPEIQDGISDKDAVALEKIVELYNDDPVSFEAAFNEMYKIGIPEVRKYCTP